MGSIKYKSRINIWLAVAFLFAAASASAAEVSDHDRFRLWNECLPTSLLVEGLGEDAAEIGLTKDAIKVAVRSGLRGVRLYSEDRAETALSDLYVRVNISAMAFGIDTQYLKVVTDQATGTTWSTTTWELSSTGMHGGDSSYIISVLAQHIDKFIDEYLRVNAEVC